MLLLTVLTLSSLAFVNYRIGDKALFYPPVVFCSVWAADLFLIWMVGDFFYPLSPETLLILLCGCLAFSLGSWLALYYPQRKATERYFTPKSSNRIINILLLVTIAGAPFYYRWIAGLASDSAGGVSFLLAVRMAMLDEANQGMAYSIFLNLAALSTIVAIIAFYENERHPKRTVLSIVLAVAMNMLTGAKVGVVTLILALLCIDWIRSRHIRWKLFVAMILVFVLAFSTITVLVHTGDASSNASVLENIASVARLFVLYTGGGTVAFDRVIREPSITPHGWQIDAAFLHIINRLGAHSDAPVGVEFVSVGPNSLFINVFTNFFAYLDFGFIGIMALVGVVGLIVTITYSRALQGRNIPRLLYASLFPGLLLSLFAEYFFMNLYSLGKLLAVCWLVYRLPVIWTKFANSTKAAVKLQLVDYQPPRS